MISVVIVFSLVNKWLRRKFKRVEKNFCEFSIKKNYWLDLMSDNDGIFCAVVATHFIKLYQNLFLNAMPKQSESRCQFLFRFISAEIVTINCLSEAGKKMKTLNNYIPLLESLISPMSLF